MKIKSIGGLVTLSLILSLGAVGCKKGLQKTTPLPGRGASVPGGSPGDLLDPNAVGPGTDGGISETGIPASTGDFSKFTSDSQTFAQETVFFDFDKANIRPNEVSKVERVAEMMKGKAGHALRIEGHCDERGTEEYNRALGERRALSVREFLQKLGVDPQWVETVSYGEDRPAQTGHNEEAWGANRRAEFILLIPPGN